ncbi:hypothetical protein DPMN_046968 [Dreissena polymorpha]|uniref:Transposase Helix-turn-helix domain-containing protein n=1 Tax=Dreissena polymorpha TaxID=45954 RepID=A0A9D4D6X8_DREPO|nr:hypothetical protein DPMN_046968 [Dreissena polymorpha]
MSVSLHDYEGNVSAKSFSTTLNKETQTVPHARTFETQTDFNTNICVPKSTRSFGTQSDFEVKEQGVQVTSPDLTFEDLKKSKMCMFYTGLPNVETFTLLFNELDDAEENTCRAENGKKTERPRVLRLVDEVFLVLMRLRLGLLLADLAQRFHVSKSTCSNITSQWTVCT